MIFQNGNANSTELLNADLQYFNGSAVYFKANSLNGGVKIKNCIFKNNTAIYNGGAVYFKADFGKSLNVFIDNCLFYKNKSLWGSLYCEGVTKHFTVKNSKFDSNISIRGAGIYYQNGSQYSDFKIDSTIFTNNSAIYEGGGVSIHDEVNINSSYQFTNNKFERNISGGGSAIFYYCIKNNSQLIFNNCNFLENGEQNENISPCISISSGAFDEKEISRVVKFNSCIFIKNHGLAIDLTYFNNYINRCKFIQNKGQVLKSVAESEINIFNSSFTDNENILLSFLSASGTTNISKLNIINNLFAHNKLKKALFIEKSSLESKYQIKFISNVFSKNLSTKPLIETNYSNLFFQNNIFDKYNICDSIFSYNPFLSNTNTLKSCKNNVFNQNPKFIDTVSYHLHPCSPVGINAGDNAALDSLGITTDLDGKPRRVGGAVDIGPYEVQKFYDVASANVIKGGCSAGNLGNKIVFDIKEGTLPFTYTWKNGAEQGDKITGLKGGNYSFTVSDSEGCKDTLSVALPIVPEFVLQLQALTLKDPTGTLSNGTIGIDKIQGGIPPYTYLWKTGDTTSIIKNLPAGIYFVTVTDAFGCILELSIQLKAKVASTEINEIQYQIYPNPTSDKLFINFENKSFNKLIISDLQGKNVFEKVVFESKNEIDVSNLPKGIYILQVWRNNKIMIREKIVVQ